MAQRTQIVAELKRALRGRGVTYAHVAKHLALSEASVKRLFAAGDFSLERLDRICELAGLELSELVEQMHQQATPVRQLTLGLEAVPDDVAGAEPLAARRHRAHLRSHAA